MKIFLQKYSSGVVEELDSNVIPNVGDILNYDQLGKWVVTTREFNTDAKKMPNKVTSVFIRLEKAS